MRTCHKCSCVQQQAEFGMAPATEQSDTECSSAVFLKLFTFREVGTQVSLVTMSCPSQRTVAPPPCLLLDIKDLLKEDARLFDWLPLTLATRAAFCTENYIHKL
jgi:hypothetical protein